ncbi:MAG: magnesium transporter [Gammaproteobacteria bacterium]|nr:magnesium transporter [Gammaproteobacteria bacterium]
MTTEPGNAMPLEPWNRLRELTIQGDSEELQSFLKDLEPTETVRALFRLSAEEQEHLVELLPAEFAAELIEDLPDVHAADILERLDPDAAADIVDELDSDFGADLLTELEPRDAQAILDEMAPAQASKLASLISYPAEVAGGLMGTEYYAYPVAARVQDFLDDLRSRRADVETLPQRVLLIDAGQRPTGAVEIADVLLAAPETPLATLSQAVEPVRVDEGLNDLEDYFRRYETLGAPVVDDEGRLVGRLRQHAVFDAIAERAQEEQLKVQGIVGGEELRHLPIATRSRRRLSWLSINVVLNIIAASVIAFYQDTIAAVIALAVFLPIVSDMSGCSGNQAIAVTMRELTLGIIRPRDALRVWWQEASVGLLNGLALGVLLGLVAYLWQGNAFLGLVVGAALAINTLVAVSIGGTVPLLLKGLRADPALASGPVLTTITDMFGFFLVLGLATLALPWLT